MKVRSVLPSTFILMCLLVTWQPVEGRVKKESPKAVSMAPVDSIAGKSKDTSTISLPDTATVGNKGTADTVTLSPASELLIRACDNYLSVNAAGGKTAEVLSLKGSVYYNNGAYQKSRDVYERVVKDFPKTPYMLEAVRMLAQSYYQEKRFAEAQSWYVKMRDVAAEGGDRQEAIVRIAESIFKMAELFEAQERYEDAAAQYERVALEFPDATIADISLSNAGLSYEKLTEWPRAILMYQRLAQRYPDSKLHPKAMFRTAKCYEKLLQWENAAQTYLQLVATHPLSDLTPASLYNAGFCFENASKFVEAAHTFEKLAMSFPKADDAADVLFKAGELYGKVNDWPSVTRVNQEFSRRFGNDIDRIVQAQCMIGIAMYMQNDQTNAVVQLKSAVTTFKRLKEPSTVNRYYAAKAQFTLGEIFHEQERKIVLTLPRTLYKKQLENKSELLDNAVESYSAVIPFQISEWTTRAIYQIGEAYEDFAIGVFRQERPPNMSVEDRLSLELGIAEAVEKYFVQRALPYHEQNVKLGIKEKIDDKHVQNSKKKLTYLTYLAGENYLALVDIVRGASSQSSQEGFARIAYDLQMLQKIAPFQERAIDLFLKCLELGSMYQEIDNYYTQASGLITKTCYTVGLTYSNVADVARSAPIPTGFDGYEKFVYKTKLLKQIETYEQTGLSKYLKGLKIASAYKINDESVTLTKEHIAQALFVRARCYDLLCLNVFKNPPYPADISDVEKDEYRARFEDVGLNFQEQAFELYRMILDYAKQDFAQGEYVNHAYIRLYQNFPQEFGFKQEKVEDKSLMSGPQWKISTNVPADWATIDYNDSSWTKPAKGKLPTGIEVTGFPDKTPIPMWYDEATAQGTMYRDSGLYLRRTFTVSEPPRRAELSIAGSSPFSVFVNGKEKPIQKPDSLSGPKFWYTAQKWDLKGELRQGKNVIALKSDAALGAGSGAGIMPYLSLTVTTFDYVPLFPGTTEPLDKKIASEEGWTFPYVKNFNLDPATPVTVTQ